MKFIRIYLKDLRVRGRSNMFANSLNPYMVLNKHLGNEMQSYVKHWSNFSSDKSEYYHLLFIKTPQKEQLSYSST